MKKWRGEILMSADINRETLRRDEALQRLADGLSEDILDTPTDWLLAEVAEDHGDRKALVREFNRVVGRTVKPPLMQQILSWSADVIAEASRGLMMGGWKPVLATIGVVLIGLVSGDIYLRLQGGDRAQSVAGPAADKIAMQASSSAERDDRLAPRAEPSERSRDSAAVAPSVAALPPAQEPAAASPPAGAAMPDNPRSVRTVTVQPTEYDRRSAQATSVSPQPPAPTAMVSPQIAAKPAASHLEQVPAQAGATAGNANVASAAPQPNSYAAAPAAQAPVAAGSAAPPSFDWPVRGRVITSFGPVPGNLRNDGINISVPEGTDIHAADDGLVVYSGSDVKGYGNLVLVRHGNSFVTAYAHASQLLVNQGDAVMRGQVIAKSGRTGQVKDPQLHFEIRKGTVPVDPMKYLPPG